MRADCVDRPGQALVGVLLEPFEDVVALGVMWECGLRPSSPTAANAFLQRWASIWDDAPVAGLGVQRGWLPGPWNSAAGCTGRG